MNGKPVDRIKSQWTACKHHHVSGRRCGNRVRKDGIRFCNLHRNGDRLDCHECQTMLSAFQPKDGWSSFTKHRLQVED